MGGVCERPFAGPAAVLAYLSRYTHRVAISNQRLVALDERGVTFRWKDYRAKGTTRHKTMTLAANEFMRRFLLHVLPAGFHRIRHYGLLGNAHRTDHLDNAHHERKPPPMAIPISTLFETASIGFAFALRCDHVISCMMRRRKMLTLLPATGPVHDLEFQRLTRFTSRGSSPALQIPIAN